MEKTQKKYCPVFLKNVEIFLKNIKKIKLIFMRWVSRKIKPYIFPHKWWVRWHLIRA
jgi:hypothetical protein